MLHFFPLVEAVLESEFGFDVFDGTEQGAADAGEGVGIADGNAILGDGDVEAAHGVVDVSGGHEVAGEGFTKFSAEALGFEELGFGACVEDAKARVPGMAKHAAAATVLKWELAEVGFVAGVADTGGGAGCCGHW